MTDEKGYIQFHCDWEPADPPAVPEALIAWRDRLHRLGLIGVYPNGIGFGNISVRPNPPARFPGREGGVEPSSPPFPGEGLGEGFFRFLISGTGTGHLPSLAPEHFAEVLAFDFAANRLRCRGAVKASSESLSHAAVYASDPAATAVIHVHHLGMWEQLRDRIPTTDHAAEAGTPEMARAIESLLRQPGVEERGLFVMGGHREGLMAFGPTLDEAGARIVAAFERFTGRPPPA
jgi:L-ribulose-5-phosphate 4-epimerase